MFFIFHFTSQEVEFRCLLSWNFWVFHWLKPFDTSPKLLKSIRGISSLHSSSKDWANIREILGFDRARETRPIRSGKFPLNSPITQTSTKFRGIFSKLTESIKPFQNPFAPPPFLEIANHLLETSPSLFTRTISHDRLPRNNSKITTRLPQF